MTSFDPVGIMMGLVPGAVGGAFNCVTGHPFDTIKVQMQMGTSVMAGSTGGTTIATRPAYFSSPIMQIMNRTLSAYGVRGLYRGVAAPLFVVTPTFAVAFGTYNCTSSLLRSYNKDNSDRLSLMQHFIAGASTAIPISIFVVPSERVKCILQAQNNSTYSTVRYTGSWDCARQLYTNGGLRSLYKGLGITLLRDGPGNGAYFAMYEMFRRISGKALGYENPNDLPKIFIVLGGGIAGIANWIVAIPFDVVKSRFQTAPEGKYFNARDVFKQIIKEEGFPALFRGMTPALLRACPANAATFVGVELTHNFLDHR